MSAHPTERTPAQPTTISREVHSEEVKAGEQRWKEAHPDKVKEAERRYRAAIIERQRLSMRSSKPAFFQRLGWLVAFAAGLAWAFAAFHLRSPYLLRFRDQAFWIWTAAGIVALAWMLVRRKTTFRRPTPLHVVFCAALAGSVLTAHARWQHERHRRMVSNTAPSAMPQVSRHLIIGWLGLEQTRALAAKGAIAGVFLTHRDFPAGSTTRDIRHVVDRLQAVRNQAGLPLLWIVTDQEGGPVEKLSPPLPRQPALGRLIAGLDRNDMISKVTAYAEAQGLALAEAGITMNFSPVVDLMPDLEPGALDLHSRIARRALSADPEIVTLAAEAYVKTLERHGIKSILKHFPGLGGVPQDTHHFAASLQTPLSELESRDWVPFRKITSTTNAGIMLGHVKITALDSVNPASCSRTIMQDLLRGSWRTTGLLVTDDFSMTPIFHGRGGISTAAEASLAAGVDLILLSYDAEAVYDLIASSISAHR